MHSHHTFATGPSGLRHALSGIRAVGDSFGAQGRTVYMAKPEFLRKQTEKNLARTLEEMGIESGMTLTLSAPDLATAIRAVVVIDD